jgi:two-component system, cell cycle response regulator
MQDQRKGAPAIRRFTVCLRGFSDAGKAAIETYCRFAARRHTVWSVTEDLKNATGVFVNARVQNDVDRVTAQLGDGQAVAVVGNSNFGSGWRRFPHPLSLTDALIAFEYFLQASLHDLTLEPSDLEALGLEVDPPSGAAPGRVVQALPESEPAYLFVRDDPADVPVRRVLVVDESDVALRFMQNRLGHLAYRCHLAHGGEEALTLLSRFEYLFVFLDANMVGIDGYQTCRAIKQNKNQNGVAPVVIMLTHLVSVGDKIRGALAGCDGYLAKPLDEKQLLALLGKFDRQLRH